MSNFWKGFLVALLIVYVISPMDLLPGPVDDILAIVFALAATKNRQNIEKRDNERIEVIDVDGTEL
ncbi:MAG: hypothetical protein IJS16_03065 [Butyrivibrio sp.]|jgi:uncharacterized membrane protein YkvA (DUF1232 family)|uniref:hypothetical protein n=1 Tax=unclassified Butyrivibrio TaxID=2639466 RepID=UPI0003B7820D|nr:MULTISPECIES: hypothetical protein [unclassified Butyrivibrio]MBQ3796045.1 hypothetical protein [Butyrivibrio sp.]MBQ6415049.1 hypothetical protein [Butyrivibrio sp.]MBQ7657940.1 hypothetical protein [Butyrivibrio sp.]